MHIKNESKLIAVEIELGAYICRPVFAYWEIDVLCLTFNVCEGAWPLLLKQIQDPMFAEAN